MLSPEGQALAEKLMTTLNKSARDAMVKYHVHACTDVTASACWATALRWPRAATWSWS